MAGVAQKNKGIYPDGGEGGGGYIEFFILQVVDAMAAYV
jgi:hypothetical protein